MLNTTSLGVTDARERLTTEMVQSRLPWEAPSFVCPHCDWPLRYLGAHANPIGGPLGAQSDFYSCSAGCGTFEYVRQTHRMHIVS